MNCSDIERLLDTRLDAELNPAEEAKFDEHLDTCADCRARWAFALDLHGQLATLPAPAPLSGFETRVLSRAWSSAARPPRARLIAAYPRLGRSAGWAAALAASLLIAIGLWAPHEPVPEVVAPTGEPLRLVFRSDTELRGVTIELDLPAGTALRGYPGQREIAWQSDLVPGTNVLELPIEVSGAGGLLVATITHDGARRAFQVRVQPPPAITPEASHGA